MGLNKRVMMISTLLTVAMILSASTLQVTSLEVGTLWNSNISSADEYKFNYNKLDVNGPDNWGKVHREWSACGKGKLQSPIDLSDKRVTVQTKSTSLRRSYVPCTAVLKNRGHDIMLKWEGNAGSIWINGTEYALKQLHWHSPSEHTINGRRYSLEMHMVHETADKKIAVVGVLYDIGKPDEFLQEMEGYIRKVKDLKEGEENVGVVSAKYATKGSRKYYRYMGSLTIPPCTEGVLWTILTKVRTASKQQVNLLREAVPDDFAMNARPVQNANDRTVGLY